VTAGAAVEAVEVGRRFELGGEQVWALRDVTLSVAPGDLLAVIGRSGSGKTTLLNLIAGLDKPSQGTIQIDGRDVGAMSEHDLNELRRKRIGFVFQSFGLLPLLSAYENIELAMRIAGAGRRERSRRTHEVLELMGLSRRANHRPYELSGGEQQRVAIARAIANRPSLILADEPTGELDSTTATMIFRLLREVTRTEGITIIVSTHDRTVMEMASRVEELADGRLLRKEQSRLFDYATARGPSPVAREVPSEATAAAGTPQPAPEAKPAEEPIPQPSWGPSDASEPPPEPAEPVEDVRRWARPGSGG
jgi:ABC-type lipoprotein export system ATPase subunit